MAAIVLPSSPAPRDAEVFYVDWGGNLTPALGGPVQRLNRLGTRHRLEVVMPPMEIDDARVWVQRLKRGVHEGVIMEFPQPGIVLPDRFAGQVDGNVAGGSSLPVRGLLPAYTFQEGQYVSISGPSARYWLYSVDSPIVANGAGEAVIGLTPMLRSNAVDNADVLLLTPLIQGTLIGDEQSYTINSAHHYGLAFGIEEDA